MPDAAHPKTVQTYTDPMQWQIQEGRLCSGSTSYSPQAAGLQRNMLLNDL